jgi:hypothetical protein
LSLIFPGFVRFSSLAMHLNIIGLLDGDSYGRFCRMRLEECIVLSVVKRLWLASVRFLWEVLCRTLRYKHDFIKRPVSLGKRHGVHESVLREQRRAAQ